MGKKMQNLLLRTLSGLLLGLVMLGAIVWSQWSYAALLFVLLVGGMLEFYMLADRQGNTLQRVLGLVTGVALFALVFGFVSDSLAPQGMIQALVAFLLLALPLMFVCELYRRNDNPAASVGTTLMGVVYVALPLSLLCCFPLFGADGWDARIVIAYIFIIWANDVFAYLVGVTLGRHRLFERISPKKSWEGFFGGLTGAVAMGVGAAYWLEENVWVWVGLSLVTAVFGVLGDLVESMLKRAADVKDSGRIIPGHGGILDRFDAVLLSTPFVFVYMFFMM